jgi:hypothetical protein
MAAASTSGASVSEPIVSLKADRPQRVPRRVWWVVRFPYDGESYDPLGMHHQLQPDGYEVRDWQRDSRSGLIWPDHDGWVRLDAMIQWEAASPRGGYREIRDQFARDPLSLSTGLDTTATDHRPPSPGMQCITKNWALFAHPKTPLALRVWHDDAQPRELLLAELKLEYRRR